MDHESLVEIKWDLRTGMTLEIILAYVYKKERGEHLKGPSHLLDEMRSSQNYILCFLV